MNERNEYGLLDCVNEPKPDRAKRQRILELLDGKTGLSTAERPRRSPHMNKKAWLALAVCTALFAALGIGTYAYAEGVEYNKAVAYFEENGLSAEGLTRAEVRAVYRDITTESYTYSKTAEVLAHSKETETVRGWEIENTEKPLGPGIEEAFEVEIIREASNGFRSGMVGEWEDDSCHVTVSRYKDGVELWNYVTEELMQGSADLTLSSGFAAACQMKVENVPCLVPAVMMFNEDGERLWLTSWGEDRITDDMTEEDVWCLIEEPDGGVTAFSVLRKYKKQEFAICVTRLDKDGNIVFATENPTGNVTIAKVFPYAGGYLARMYGTPHTVDGRSVTDEYVAMIDRDGFITNDYSFEDAGKRFKIESIAAHDGRLYVSVTAIDLAASDALIGEEDSDKRISAEKFAPHIDEVVAAILFVIDENTGNVINYYQVSGAAGSDITVGSGVEWKVNRLVSAEFIPAWRDLSMGSAAVWSYRFALDGSFVSSVDTGESCVV